MYCDAYNSVTKWKPSACYILTATLYKLYFYSVKCKYLQLKLLILFGFPYVYVKTKTNFLEDVDPINRIALNIHTEHAAQEVKRSFCTKHLNHPTSSIIQIFHTPLGATCPSHFLDSSEDPAHLCSEQSGQQTGVYGDLAAP